MLRATVCLATCVHTEYEAEFVFVLVRPYNQL